MDELKAEKAKLEAAQAELKAEKGRLLADLEQLDDSNSNKALQLRRLVALQEELTALEQHLLVVRKDVRWSGGEARCNILQTVAICAHLPKASSDKT